MGRPTGLGRIVTCFFGARGVANRRVRNEHSGDFSPNRRCILAAQSFPLRAMFDGAFKEGSERVVALRDVEPSTFALLLDFLYDRSIKINAENVEAMLELSARYGVSLLRRNCCAFIARSANPSNACGLLAVADRFDCHRLRKELLAYVLKVRSVQSVLRQIHLIGFQTGSGHSLSRVPSSPHQARDCDTLRVHDHACAVGGYLVEDSTSRFCGVKLALGGFVIFLLLSWPRCFGTTTL